MLSLSRLAATAVATAAFSVASFANPVLHGTTKNPTGFTGLQVDGTTYNVAFTTNESYLTAFASTPPTFLGNESGALDAAIALVDALNANDVSGLGNYSFPPDSVGAYDVFVPSEAYDGGSIFSMYAATKSEVMGDSWFPVEGGGSGSRPGGLFGQRYSVFAIFSAQAIPEPSTTVLLASGLAILVFIRKKRIV